MCLYITTNKIIFWLCKEARQRSTLFSILQANGNEDVKSVPSHAAKTVKVLGIAGIVIGTVSAAGGIGVVEPRAAANDASGAGSRPRRIIGSRLSIGRAIPVPTPLPYIA